MTTADQRAQTCPTCQADPHAAPGRYCTRPCRCGHASCPAFASWVPRVAPLADVIYLPEPRATSSAWANREESTWIDKM